ncbi:hypothetical protein PIB30_019067 [Stylosanthes scabra]|uniref:Uncharacterized protein n=1 Tax=Stylosanthes scabra TaxID=79078 RepID=A0ABU6T9U7_9FABA|nr:hypothetical protein [Stylosanthes scabra]
MESVETGECLWMVTTRHIFGIRVEKLQEMGKNEVQPRHWKSNLISSSNFHNVTCLPLSSTQTFLRRWFAPFCHQHPPTLLCRRHHVGLNRRSSGRHHPSATDPSIILRLSCMMHVSCLGDVGNCSVAMTWSMEEDYKRKPKIYALLVDNQDYCICGKQCLEEACERLSSPPPLSLATTQMSSLLTLAKAKFVFSWVVGTRRRACVEVVVNQVYDMTAYKEDFGLHEPCRSFLYSFTKGMPLKHAYPQHPISGMRKRKLPRKTMWDISRWD